MYNADDAGANLYTEPDTLGSTAGILDVNASQHVTYEYDAFGVLQGGAGTYPGSHPLEEGFGGGVGYQEEYGTGGLVRCGNRYYNPYFGRFITKDLKKSGTNWCVYCANDPVNTTDPTGNTILAPTDPNATAAEQACYPLIIDLAFVDAISEISKSETGNDELTVLVNSPIVYTVTENKAVADQYEDSNHTINWNPDLALKMKDDNGNFTGGIQDAAMALGHELGHAYDDDTDHKGYTNRTRSPLDPPWDSKEEYWNITRNEDAIESELHESIRPNHSGQNIDAPWPW